MAGCADEMDAVSPSLVQGEWEFEVIVRRDENGEFTAVSEKFDLRVTASTEDEALRLLAEMLAQRQQEQWPAGVLV